MWPDSDSAKQKSRGLFCAVLLMLGTLQMAIAADRLVPNSNENAIKNAADSAMAVNDNVVVLRSVDHAVTFLELYSSQGCYSCPPAEAWINTFVDHEQLWSRIIPINFHVDYWDYLGWSDPFSLAEFSRRQRQYHRQGHTSNVATPGFVVNGEGWNGWFRQRALPLADLAFSGQLQTTFDANALGSELAVAFESTRSLSRVNVHVALLGFGIATPIPKGENSGKTLKHEFVVVGYRRGPMVLSQASRWTKSLTWPKEVDQPMRRQALVVWVTAVNDPAPLQVLGGWLPEG